MVEEKKKRVPPGSSVQEKGAGKKGNLSTTRQENCQTRGWGVRHRRDRKNRGAQQKKRKNAGKKQSYYTGNQKRKRKTQGGDRGAVVTKPINKKQ